ncbi:MAG: oxidoreductase family protein [Pirellulaceae bacterium]
MNSLTDTLCQITGATSASLGEEIQSLWSGYGVIQRAKLHGLESGASDPQSVVLKHIDVTAARPNRRGWSNQTSHDRKVRSYQVEKIFYESFSGQCDTTCEVPNLIAAHEKQGEDGIGSGWIIVLTDLDSQGFNVRRSQVQENAIHACLRWLANFHATFMQKPATGLWPVGTYWHLETRPDEFAAMPDGPLKRAANSIDLKLSQTQHQTLVHGDAKVANFCFSGIETNRVAAVDFQYVGRGCGMKDVAYFISSCLNDAEAAEQQTPLLDYYFQQLQSALTSRKIEVEFTDLEHEWRELYPFAWADFCRFLSGWSPGHWKLNSYSQRITQSALDLLAAD